MARPDVLLVSLGTTLGWRVADELLLAQLERAGASTQAVAVGRGAADRLRRGYPANDLVEMHAARRAVRTAVERHEPRALIVSSTTAAMLLPSLPAPYAVRFDAPARLNRPGARNALLRGLERRAMRRARLTIPFSVAGAEALPEGAARPVVVSPPIDPSAADSPAERERVAVAYVPDPKAKGLEILCSAWRLAHVEDARLEVFGIEPERARRHLERTGVPEPKGVEWRGMAPALDFRAALRRAHVFAAAARWEDFGQAQLEALADGALLATVPSGGAYEALAVARELEPRLAADTLDPGALAECLRAAFELPPERVARYRHEAAMKLAAYSPQALASRMASEVIPALLH